MKMIEWMGCFGAKREWIPRLTESFMVGYSKTSIRSYIPQNLMLFQIHTVFVRQGMSLRLSMASLGAVNVSRVLKSLNDQTQLLHRSSSQMFVSQV